MKTPKPKPTARKPKTDKWETNRRRIYVTDDTWTPLSVLCAIRGTTVSALLAKLGKAELRKQAPLLRKHNIALPESVFAKAR